MKTMINDIDIEAVVNSLKNDLKNTKKFKDTQYFESYFEFVKYFACINKIDKHSLTIGAYFSYGWIPTILKNFNMDGDVTEALRVFNNVKNNQPIADDQEYMSLIRYGDCK